MSEIKPEDLNSQAVPFFARFLEGQNGEDLSDQQSEAISGGCTVVTQKYPSDNEDGGVVTKKYPSDSDEAVTQKYPSDGDDALPTQ
ncbi:MAG: microviridin/marinostatin family tricyclic proteinase inhibitor [Nostoc sp.]|uniref:microviridin/marinostatin family tricyclic proteinase inhibitor n=1 Tax=unclassified Nostoc TaxID=2593658 RepID=UPI0025E8B460|nr:microviridin/marinostatin family tricyclic proteinase inhibitor [Nostoc sp. NOS(2021)]MBN3898726.1 microviridin/marinostatin family tricyclic proteinase inhibitor [Nostoc sp. NOS(2021)]